MTGRADIHIKDNGGNSALDLAAARGLAGATRALVDARADVEVKDAQGETRLIRALKAKQADLRIPALANSSTLETLGF